MAIIYLDQLLPVSSVFRQATYPLDEKPSLSDPGRISSILGLAGGGVYPANTVTCIAVRSYRAISPLPVFLRKHRPYIFCGTFPRVTPGGR